MEQGATGINSSVPTASLTGRIWFFLLLLRTSTHRWLGRPSVSVHPPSSGSSGLRPCLHTSEGPKDRWVRAPGASAHFVTMNTATDPSVAWLAARGGGANLARPSEAWSPTPPARPLYSTAGLRAKVLLSPRIRGIPRAACVPRAARRPKMPRAGPKARIRQQLRDRRRCLVTRRHLVPAHRVLPAPGNTPTRSARGIPAIHAGELTVTPKVTLAPCGDTPAVTARHPRNENGPAEADPGRHRARGPAVRARRGGA